MTYYIIKGGEQQGPYNVQQLAELKITSDTLVWTSGMQDWTPAWKIEELRFIFDPQYNRANGQAGSQQPDQDMADGQQNDSEDQRLDLPPMPGYVPPVSDVADKNEKPHRDRSKTALIIVGIVAAILIIMSVTTPNKQQHEEAICGEVMGAFDKMLNDSMMSDDGATAFMTGVMFLGKTVIAPIVEGVVSNNLRVNNYIVFSKGVMTIGGKTKTVSIGLLGHVWTVDAEDIEKVVESDSSIFHSSTEGDDDSQVDKAAGVASQKMSEAADRMMKKAGEQAEKAAEQAMKSAASQVKDNVKKQVQQNTDSTSGSIISQAVDEIFKALGID